MLSVDSRVGSVELAPIFEAMRMPHVVEELPAADLAFQGNGPRGPCMVGIERKRTGDLLASMRTGRLVGEQLPKMFDYYDFTYLVVEGITRANPHTGVLEEGIEDRKGSMRWRSVRLGNQTFMWQDVDGYLTTLEHSKLKYRRTDNPVQTAYLTRALHHWYTEKQWHEHKSLKQLYSAAYPQLTLDDKDDLVRRVAKELPGIGPAKSLSVAMKFRSVLAMVLAERKEWETIPNIGGTIAKRVWQAIRGEIET